MTQEHQTISAGSKVSNKYGGLGYTGKRMTAPPSQLVGLLCSRPGVGKTVFINSCPDAFIINVDGSSTPGTSVPQATIWPGVNAEGRLVEPTAQGDQVIPQLTWEAVQEKKEALLSLARAGHDRPRMVALDTLDTAIDIVKEWELRRVQKERERRGQYIPEAFQDLHGPSAWDRVYTEIVDFARDLHSAGYGVYYLCHLSDKYVDTAEKKADGSNVRILVENTLKITDNFASSLHRIAEFVAVIVQKPRTVETQHKAGMKVTVKTETVYDRYLTFTGDNLHLDTKRRVPMPDEMLIPEGNGWRAFEEAYLKASNSPAKESQ